MKLILIANLCLITAGLAADSEQKQKEYRLQAGDVIASSIYQEDDMSAQAAITKTGKVSLPLIGTLEIVGLTSSEAEEKIRGLYQKDYFVNPRVSVTIVGFRKKFVTVSGAVLNPGPLPFPENGKFNMAAAIAMAGGVLPQGNSRSITIAKRKGGSKKYVLANSGEVNLDPGDTIVVPMIPVERPGQVKIATVSGKVSKPGPIGLPRDGKIDVLTAIALAGGFDKIANTKTAILQRKTAGGFNASSIDIRGMRDGKISVAYLYEGDILIIKESRF